MKPNQFIAIVCLLLAIVLVAIDNNIIPEPTPEPRPTTLHAIIVEESGDRSPELAVVLTSMEVRGLFEEFRPIDPDTPVHPDFQPYVERGKEAGLPRLFLVDPAGKVWHEGAVPLSVAEWRELVTEVKS